MGAHQAGDRHPAQPADHKHDQNEDAALGAERGLEPVAEQIDQEQQQRQLRQRQEEVGEPHQRMPERAARHAGERADQRADNDRDRHRGKTDRERDASAIDHAGENVLPQIIGAEGMGERGPSRPRVEIDLVDADAPDEGAENHRRDQNQQQHRADHRKLVTAIAPPGLAPRRLGGPPLSGGRCEGQASHTARPR